MNERIKYLREEILKITQEEFSSKIQLSRNFIAQIETGKKKPSERTIRDICKEFGVNGEWIRTGKGDMFPKRTRNQQIMDFVNTVMESADGSFEKRFFLALTKLNESDWEALNNIIQKINEED